jgi:murein DD-endopeptidase MepM/ murein hydrolase activator NlpD
MQIMITHGSLATTRVLHFSRAKLVGLALFVALLLMFASGAIYHFVFLKAAQSSWPIVGSMSRLVVKDEVVQRERFLRENLDAIATKLGEMQAKVLKLEAMGERVAPLAGLKPDEFKALIRTEAPAPAPSAPRAGAAAAASAALGGPFIPGLSSAERVALEGLQRRVGEADVRADITTDWFVLLESRLLEGRMAQLLMPSTQPVNAPVGSGFGFRSDPFTGRAALHAGLDFPAPPGTPILAAAGGVVVNVEYHPAYGNLLEIDHGNGLVTRYAHALKVLARKGDLVKRGQTVAEVGSTGRSTGPHLHFEVLVDGVPQDPARFLAGGRSAGTSTASGTR